jgi:hypothetical protein
VEERALDFSIGAAAGMLGVVLLAAAALRLSEPVASPVAALPLLAARSHAVRPPQSVGSPRHVARATRDHAPARLVQRSLPVHRAPIIVNRRPVPIIVVRRPLPVVIARALVRAPRVSAVSSRLVPKARARLPAATRHLAPRPNAHPQLRARSVDREATPEPPIGYDPEPAIAEAELAGWLPSDAATALPGLAPSRHRR